MCSQRVFKFFVVLLAFDSLYLAAASPSPRNNNNQNQRQQDPISKLGLKNNQVHRRVKRESSLLGRILNLYDWATGLGSGSDQMSEAKEGESRQELVDNEIERGDEDKEESKNDDGGSVDDENDEDSGDDDSNTTMIARTTIQITIRMMAMIMCGLAEGGSGVVVSEIGMGTEIGIVGMEMENMGVRGRVATDMDKVEAEKEISPLKSTHDRKLIDKLSLDHKQYRHHGAH